MKRRKAKSSKLQEFFGDLLILRGCRKINPIFVQVLQRKVTDISCKPFDFEKPSLRALNYREVEFTYSVCQVL